MLQILFQTSPLFAAAGGAGGESWFAGGAFNWGGASSFFWCGEWRELASLARLDKVGD